ncbi:uncharacterized protein LAESUDRAFT_734417 [Laetiporus sulphureus 93-53]|uniref:DNA mismatch repair protein MSH3 n=1 Tax=Laetiporus sulphureus 93-53 TaxID=1314785 RepID=A0A165HEG1_9APHY|nr:uncharacterized protein LAESUDRAFT_734417 [Laetiporus sulphureus 93-53]KZT11630.1 hypothetical protein LAESUDRAFT_734417 [Laetiporus sulphureus 93-53]
MSPSTPKKQTSISSFFVASPVAADKGHQKRRAVSPIDLTGDSYNSTSPPSTKRPRTTTSSFFSIAGPSTQSTQDIASNIAIQERDGRATEQWQFDPNAPSQPTGVLDEEQRKRHERAKRILLGDSEFFRKSSEGVRDVNPEDADGDEGDDGGGRAASNTAAEPGSDEAFNELMEMFANSKAKPMKGKRKAMAAPNTRVKVQEIGPSGLAYTPLELQIRDLKSKHPGTMLMIEVGYKFYFFGDDAPIAAKELGMVCFRKRNFMCAFVPAQRKDIYLKKLLSQGHKVGIVEQTETAALKKAGDNRNELFSRKLTHLYTAATYIEDLNSVDDLDPTFAPPLMCVVEQLRGGMGADERVRVGMVVISPSTGDVVWDEFDDNHMRTELETRLVHTKPYELLLPETQLSKYSEKMIAHTVEYSSSADIMTEHRTRIERFKDDLTYTEAFSMLTKFYTDKTKTGIASEGYNSGRLMAAVADFPKLVVLALAHAINYLMDFNLQDCLRETRFFAKFTERTHMLLSGNTLEHLEIYRNQTDRTTKGSLIWILDHTSTNFGARMLRSWVGRPLVDKRALQDRIDAVEEVLADESPKLTQLRELLRRLPDLAKGLCRIQYGKCTPQELANLLPSFSKIANTFPPIINPEGRPFKSELLNDIVTALPKLREPMRELLDSVSLKMAKEGKKEALWTDPDKYPDIDSLTASIQVIESELVDELRNIRRRLKKPALLYSTWLGEEYLVEIKKNENRQVPHTWQLISSTKTLRRYRTPEVREKVQQRAQFKEALDAAANKAYQSFLGEISQKYYALMRDAVNKLAVADCLLSLARVALQEGYVKPQFTEDDTLEIVEGRHPMVEVLRSEPFVPNTVRMGAGHPASKIITGPNMGGKSSVVRMIAICAIVAQIGSYVPAVSLKIGMLDGILVRMGASDELARGRSTFMVEMQETNEILQNATPKSLVILDELGRGTSTIDGMAIADAVLQHLLQNVKCKTLFITHYPQVASDVQRMFPTAVENVHMSYTEDTRIDGTREVTFLYRLTPGVTTESFGVECARLAGVSEPILRVASSRSEEMRRLMEGRIRRNKYV